MQEEFDPTPIFFILAMIAGYVLPTVVAFYRGHPNRWLILIVNVAFGATFVGWLGALVWAAHAAHKPTDPASSRGGESGINLFANDPIHVAIEHVSTSDTNAPRLYRYDLHSIAQRLEKLKELRDSEAISADEFRSLKGRLLKNI